MAESEWIKDGSDQTFMADVMETSKTTPVIVDFWAPWCGPCRQLGPTLEKLVTAAGGKVHLVKINVDENPGISGQLQVRSIPAVYGFKDGKPVDGFAGALPESDVQKFIDRLTGDADGAGEAKELIARAEQSLDMGDTAGAAQDFAAALQVDHDNPAALAGMARVYLANDDAEGARSVLAMVKGDDKNHAAVVGARKQLELMANAPNADELDGLKTKVADNPQDLDARFALSEALSAKGDFKGAMDELFAILRADLNWQDQKARQQLLTLFEAAGANSDVTRDGRKRLSSLLFA